MNNRFVDEAYNSTASAAKQLEKSAADISSEIQREAKQWLSQIEQQIIKNPGMALGIALGVGVVLGWMWKRS